MPSHDLRTPLVSVIGAFTGLEGDVSEASRRALVEKGLDEARRLDRYVQNLLNMTRIEYGALKPKRGAVDAGELIGIARADLRNVLGGHRIEIDLPPDLPNLEVDPVLIGQGTRQRLRERGQIRARRLDHSHRCQAGRKHGHHRRHRRRTGASPRQSARRCSISSTASIVRGFVEAHEGAVRALAEPGGRGTRIEIDLPTAMP